MKFEFKEVMNMLADGCIKAEPDIYETGSIRVGGGPFLEGISIDLALNAEFHADQEGSNQVYALIRVVGCAQSKPDIEDRYYTMLDITDELIDKIQTGDFDRSKFKFMWVGTEFKEVIDRMIIHDLDGNVVTEKGYACYSLIKIGIVPRNTEIKTEENPKRGENV